MSTVIALTGNPDSGKTTTFNRLVGRSQRAENWPGVNVERKEGGLKDKKDVIIVDLPGVHSFSPYSQEEIICRDFLLNDRPDAVINIVNASNLERSLYLTLQILETGIPVVIALNMMDVVRREGIKIDVGKISKALGCPIVETVALKGDGIKELTETIVSAAGEKAGSIPGYSEDLEGYISAVEEAIRGKVPEETERWYALKLLERDERLRKDIDEDVSERVDAIVSSMEEKIDNDADGIIAGERYSFIERVVDSAVDKSGTDKRGTRSDRIDRIVTSRRWGLPIFALVMFAIYFVAIETVGGWGTEILDDYIRNTVRPAAESWLIGAGVDGWLVGLIVKGIISGVGTVVAFLPQMIVLFFILFLLEECGYMSRVAVVMDHLFRRFGLSGKSFISILVGMGCGVPGIMSSRSIEGETERKITAMTVTFIPCSAKLLVIALIAGALFGQSALIAISVYLIGILCILMSGIIMKKWKSLAGTPSPFIIELPSYHMPYLPSVLRLMSERLWSFIKNAGTFVLLACVLVWFLSSFDWHLNTVDAGDSMLAGIGNAMRWVFVPLGFGDEWEFSMATITGLLSKENIVGSLGVLFSSGGPGGEGIWEILGSMLTPAGGYAFLLFNMICAPCIAAVGAMKGELGSWKETAKAVTYQCILAYALTLIFYQFAMIILGYGVGWGIIPAVIALAGLIYVLASKDPFSPFRRAERDA
ncbi:MAG: ferrous iron transport protein B [Methanomassiliicoccaceae archaeon]|nr:ferrous iron transport protein B [Methanomassiliicoccaceae archaeon]